MPFPGGGADKVGNRYELRWTVRQFIRLLRGDATWIHLEPIGAEGECIEFRLGRNDGRIEVHQVKRQQAGKGHWTVADLDRVGVLEGFRKHTVDGGADFVFVSTQAPKSLPELQYRAEIAPDFPAFQASLPPELQKDFDDLQCRLFGVNKDFDDLRHPLFGVNNDQQTWRTIRQSRWIAQDERELDDTILALLGAYLTGDPQAALGVLAMFALDAVHRRITPQDLWGELEREGILPSDIARDKNLVVRLRQCQEDYFQSQKFTIGGLVLPRTEADTAIVKFLDPTESTRSIFLVGPAGVGKTGVAGQIVRRMAEIGWLVLPLRLDRLDPTQRPVEIGRQRFGREKSSVAILAGLAAGGDCLLVIEQLDAVSVVSGRRPEVFYAVDALVREARAHSNMRLLLVCRAFDLDNDQRLRDLQQQEKTRATSIPVGLLDPVQVKEAVAHLGLAPDRLTFRRSQVRQIMAYRRNDDFGAYLDDLRDCLSAPDVRFHIKKLMISMVGQVLDPRPEEWAIFKDYLQEWTGRPADSVRSALWSSTPWFRFLHDQDVLAAWLASDSSEIRMFSFHWLKRMVESDEKSVGETDYVRQRVRRFWRRHGREQFELLGALPPNKLSPIGRRRIGELSRKASSLGWQLERPLSIRGGTVVSPLPEQTTAKMTDAQWLSAVRKYVNAQERVWLKDRILGGAGELAQDLKSQTKAQPERFARLMLALPDEANERYFEAIVMGLQDGGLPLNLLERVSERAHNRPGRPHGRWLPRAIASHGGQGLSTALLDVVAWYATEDPDPAGEVWQKAAGDNRPYYRDGINTARGSAAIAIANLIAQAQHYWEYFASVLERMVADPSVAVRTCVAKACTQALRYDRPRAIALFLKPCEAEDALTHLPPSI